MSQASFNLLDELWIPVENLQGVHEEVSLSELFQRATSLKRISDASPAVTAALYRLLFVITSRTLLLEDIEDWQDAWDDANFGPKAVSYVEKYRHRFDLFSEDEPFAQVRGMPENCRPFPWTKLALELPPNSSKLLFDHTSTQNPPLCSAAEAARNLLASTAFTVGAGRSCTGQTSNAPLTAAIVAIPEGRNLLDTLLANALPAANDDLPLWEKPQLTATELIKLNGGAWGGHAERLTWPARSVELIPEDEYGNIRWIKFGMGWKTPEIAGDRDPWVTYQTTSKGQRFPLKLNPDRMVWRDFHAMLAGSIDGSREAVEIVSRLSSLNDAERTPPRTWTILVAAISADKASIRAWSQERWQVPALLVNQPERLADLNTAIVNAEDYGESVRKIVWVMVQNLLGGPDSVGRAQVTATARKMPVSDAYWTTLEAHFQELLESLGTDTLGARTFWHAAIQRSLRAARDSAFALVGRDSKALRAWAKASSAFGRLSWKLEDEVRPSKPRAEEIQA